MKIPAGISANNSGLIGVRAELDAQAGSVDVSMGFEHYQALDRDELAAHLSNALVLMGVNGTPSGEHDLFQLPDSPLSAGL